MKTLIAAIALVAASTVDATACKCSDPSLGEAAGRAELAFVGTITKVTETKLCDPQRPTRCTPTFAYEVTVEGVWKGKVAATVTMESGSGRGDCSRGRLGKVAGQRWLFLTNGTHEIRLCSGTQRATGAVIGAMTKRFGAPKT